MVIFSTLLLGSPNFTVTADTNLRILTTFRKTEAKRENETRGRKKWSVYACVCLTVYEYDCTVLHADLARAEIEEEKRKDEIRACSSEF